MTDLVFLSASVPLTKTCTRLADGTISKSSYPHVYEVTSHDAPVKTLADFATAMKLHASRGRCMLKGGLVRPLVKESRKGTTDANAPTDWICLDLDGIPVTTIDDFLQAVGLFDVSHIIQYSASHGIDAKGVRAHVFMFLDKPYAAPLLKQWLIGLNLSTPLLNNNMALTKTGNAILWPLDISACQNDKLLYIAPPNLVGLQDPVGKNRISVVKRKQDKLVITAAIPSTAKNRERTLKRIEELRDAEGLPKRKITFRMHGSTEVMVKPDACTITERKTERGFTYFNLNGGDSWAYYHPEDCPDYIYNFKGEPAYLTKELMPEYWQELCSSAGKTNSQGIKHLAFCDFNTSAYWRGTYNEQTDHLDISIAKTETQLRHFCKQHGVPIGDFVPEWDLRFDPTDAVRVDVANKVVNLFELSTYMRAKAKPVNTPPSTIMRVITHALGGDQAVVDHFINWLAFILQKRARTGTAWVLHGTEGTGKGVMMNNILRPLFGHAQTSMRRMEEFNEQWNPFMKQCFIVFVDEMQASALMNSGGVMAKLRNFITEPTVQIREMRLNAYETVNYTNWIFASNKPDPVAIPKDDRRHNVAKFQSTKLKVSPREIEVDIPGELQAFHDYLLYYALDEQAARTVLQTADRDVMISISEASIDTVASACLDGNFGFFMDQLPTSEAYKSNALQVNKVEDYKRTLSDLLSRTDRNTGVCNVSRDELMTVFDFTVGIDTKTKTPNKFTSLLKHHRIHTTKVWMANRTVNGMRIMWRDLEHWQDYLDTINPPQQAKAPAKGANKKVMGVK